MVRPKPQLWTVFYMKEYAYIIPYPLLSTLSNYEPVKVSWLCLVSAVTCCLGLRVRIPPAAWIAVCCECCVLSVRGLCEVPVTHPEDSYRVCVCVRARTRALLRVIRCDSNPLYLQWVGRQRSRLRKITPITIVTIVHIATKLLNSSKQDDQHKAEYRTITCYRI
jgi:hypothetical protein